MAGVGAAEEKEGDLGDLGRDCFCFPPVFFLRSTVMGTGFLPVFSSALLSSPLSLFKKRKLETLLWRAQRFLSILPASFICFVFPAQRPFVTLQE